MSYSPPKVFISATAADLRSVREAITESLISIGCLPVEVASSSPMRHRGSRVARKDRILPGAGPHRRDKIRPRTDPGTLPAGASRRSYTQMEYHIGAR